tara:strand:- start:6587 stop:7147 length:561 start_codon:yes stop_codon:yes gene_type:complete
MRKLLIAITFMLSMTSIAQEQFKLTETEFIPTQSVILKKDSTKTAEELYNLTLGWINEMYKQPDEVIKARTHGEFIKINGSTNFYVKTGVGRVKRMVKYTITFKFKDGLIKMSVIDASTYTPPSQYSSGGWHDAEFHRRVVLKKNGKPRKALNEMNNQLADQAESEFNALLKSLLDFEGSVVDESW